MKLEKIFILLQIFLIIYIEIIFGQYQKEFPDSSSRPISQDIQQLKFEIFLGLAQRKECLLLAPLALNVQNNANMHEFDIKSIC